MDGNDVRIGIENALGIFSRAATEAAGHIGFEWIRPSVLFRPALSLDGNQYCALYGEDLMSGCAGFGPSPAEAMQDFDTNWGRQYGPLDRS